VDQDFLLMGWKQDRQAERKGCGVYRAEATYRNKNVDANDNAPFVEEVRLAA
jgi:hypothetical protein